MNELYIIAVFQAFFFSLILLSKRGRRAADVFLSLYFISLGLLVFYFYYINKSLYLEYPHFLGVGNGLFFLPGPFIYFYVKSLIGESPSFKSVLLHLSPYLLYSLIYLPFFLLPGEEKINYNHQLPLIGHDYFELPAGSLKVGLYSFYHIYCFLLVSRFQRQASQTVSTDFWKSIGWIKITCVGGLILCFTSLGAVFLSFAGLLSYNYFTESVLMAFNALFILVTGYFGFRQLPLAASGEAVSVVEPLSEQPSRKYKHSGLSEERLAEIAKSLRAAVEEHKLFLKNDLTIQELSKEVSIPAHHISEALNQKEGKNFFEFINDYRIQEAKRLLSLKAYRNRTLEGIGYEAGFNSRSSFYSYFKKVEGITPAVYQKQLN